MGAPVCVRVYAGTDRRVYVYVRMYVCLRTCMRVRALRVCVYAYRCVCVYAPHVSVYVYAGTRRMRLYVCLCVCLYVCVYLYADACPYVRKPGCLSACLRRVCVSVCLYACVHVCLHPCLYPRVSLFVRRVIRGRVRIVCSEQCLPSWIARESVLLGL